MLSCRSGGFRQGENPGARGTLQAMCRHARFRGLELWRGFGIEVPLATTFRSRLLGLSWLDRERAGAGLLLPECHSIHTFGMRFELDLVFLDARGRPVRVARGVSPARIVGCGRARAVLEIVPDRSCVPDAAGHLT